MSSRWDLGWSKRADEDGRAYFVVSFPSGSAIVKQNPNGKGWNAHINMRNGDNRHSTLMTDEFDAMDWAQDKIHEMVTGKVESATSVKRQFTVKPKTVQAAISPFKTRYTVHWMSPSGKDCLLGGSNDLQDAVDIGIEQAYELMDNPWETDERKRLFLENMYIAEGDEAIDSELDDYTEGLMSMIDSRKQMKGRRTATASSNINASVGHTYGMEPSASEYGEMIDSWKQRLKTRYEPFVVKPVYFNRNSVNSTGYRITLDIEPTYDEHGPRDDFYYEEWILDKNGSTFNPQCKLYGPFEPGDVNSWSQLKLGTEIGTFKDLDQAMTYLFENVDYPDE